MQTIKGGNETILVVDDEESVRRFVKAALKTCGYNIIDAPGGEEALALAGSYSEEIDLLLTDVVMPGMDGNKLSERLRLLRPTLKVLFVSGYVDDLITNRNMLNDGVAFLAKPFTPNVLAAKVRDLLDNAIRR